MPHLEINGTNIFYQVEGSGKEILVFAHGLLFNAEMFRKQIDHFKANYKCVSFDFKGQGRSGVSKSGYDMDTLTNEVLEIMDFLGIGKFHFIGLSMGGFVGMRLALRVPDRLSSLVLLNTTAEEEPKENIPKYSKLNFVARWFGLNLVANKVLPIVFAPDFLENSSKNEERELWKKNIISNHKIGITKATKGVIHREGVIDQIHKITTPTLILTGEYDIATTPEKSMRMHKAISGSEIETITGAAHSSTIENPKEVIVHIEEFLNKHVMGTSGTEW